MGRGRYLSVSALSGMVRMPTPSAVLAGVCALSALGERYPPLKNPVAFASAVFTCAGSLQ